MGEPWESHDVSRSYMVPPMAETDAKAFLSSIMGIPTNVIEGFLIVLRVRCGECGEAHGAAIQKNMDIPSTIHMAAGAIRELVERLDDEDDDAPQE